MTSKKSLSDRIIAVISVVSFLAFTFLIALSIYFHRRRTQEGLHAPSNQSPQSHPLRHRRPSPYPLPFLRLLSSHSPFSSDSDTEKAFSPIKLENRKQTHSDRKVFSWFDKVDPDADKRGIFRLSIPDRKSVWKLSEEEMRDLSAALDRLRGRESVMSGRESMMGPARLSDVS